MLFNEGGINKMFNKIKAVCTKEVILTVASALTTGASFVIGIFQAKNQNEMMKNQIKTEVLNEINAAK